MGHGVWQYRVVTAMASALRGSTWAAEARGLVIPGESLTYNFLKDRPLMHYPSGSKDIPQHPLPPGHVLGQPAAECAAAYCGPGGECVP